MHREDKLYFEDPLLKLGIGTRLWVKSTKSIFNIVSLVAGLVMIFSDVPQVFYLGIFLLAVVLYNSLLAKLFDIRGNFSGGNLLFFVETEVRDVLQRASDRSALMGGSFLLHLTRELIETAGGEEILRRLSIEKEEFASQAERHIGEEKRLRETKAWRLRKAEELVVKALTTQIGKKHPVTTEDLLRAMVYMDNERVQRLFNIFGVTESVMENSYQYRLRRVGSSQ